MSGIQTGGFNPTVMPTYTPVNPGLVAFNPDALNNGILSAFKVATEDEKLKAFKMQNDELAQLREDRLTAAHAKLQNEAGVDQSAMTLRPLQTGNALAGLQLTSDLQPGVRQMALTGQGFDIADQAVKRPMQSSVLATEAAAQPDKNVATLNDAALAAEKSSSNLDNAATASDTARIQAELANDQAYFDQQTQGMTHDQKLAALTDEIRHAQSDRDVKRAGALLENEVKKATATQLQAKSAYELGQGRQPASRDKTMADLSQIERIKQSELSAAFDESGVPLAVYRANLLTGGEHNPIADEKLRYVTHLEALAKETLNDHMTNRQQNHQPPVAPITVSYTPNSPAAPAPAAPAADPYDQNPAGADQVRYDSQGRAWTKDVNGNVVPYNP